MAQKADHRLVQPRPEHYKQRMREDGVDEDVLCGPYSLEQRNRYFRTMISLYTTRHPDAKHHTARRAVFGKWRQLVFSTIGDEYVPATSKKDVVKLQ